MKKIIFLSCLILLSLLVIALGEAFDGGHTVVSDKPNILRDGDTGEEFREFLGGHSIISWKVLTRHGFFYAKVIVKGGRPYEFVLVAIANSRDYIEGLFDIYRKGELVCSGCIGRLYGIIKPVGGYFELHVKGNRQCINDERWSCYEERWRDETWRCVYERWCFRATITDRFDIPHF